MRETGRDQPYHHGDLRRVIIETAMDMLVEQQAWKFTLREVARRAGVSHNAPYKHFTDKAALLNELAFLGFDRLHDSLSLAVRAGGGDFAAELDEMAQAYLRFGAENPALYHLMFGADVAAAAELHMEPRALAPFDLLLEVLRRGQLAGEVIDRPVRGLAAACWAQLHGLTTLKLDGLLRPEKVGEDAIAQALGTLRSGMQMR
ncbi:TetR/AcrR family transcriptional regulator [Paracoccus sp. 11-3]|uniref:TetR/AcrR family transcriptional regulator n=1 Tax=Paracoccus amoyensis TaxID=2760093 RepID=A0A926G9H9_9RHOB|nr:TetR/AcrR family transcriptional regulator [Paracoccus amoyensis]MBC9248353.1 TetR/AcrR family transcriptional regulator [Paracoccus amoyensis]